MASQIIDNLNYRGKKPNFVRDSFATLAEMAAFSESDIDEGHLSFCVEDGKYYSYNSSNDSDETTGRWREFSSGSSLPEEGTSGQVLTKTDSGVAWSDDKGVTYEATAATSGCVPIYDTTDKTLKQSDLSYGGSIFLLGDETNHLAFSKDALVLSDGSREMSFAPTSIGFTVIGSDGTYTVKYFTYDSIAKLEGIEEGAQVNQNAYGKFSDGTNVIAATDKQDTMVFGVSGGGLELNASKDNGVVITTKEATTTSMGMMSAADKTKLDGLQDLPVKILTQSEYDALTTKDTSTLYIIQG